MSYSTNEKIDTDGGIEGKSDAYKDMMIIGQVCDKSEKIFWRGDTIELE